MKIVQINSSCGSGSTGKICVGISKVLGSQEIENYILYSTGNSSYQYAIKCASRFPKLQALRSRILGNYGFNSVQETKKLINELERIQPDIVQLHNLHAHNCHLEILFNYLRRKNIKIYWTFHDCWAFTAYCPYYDMAACDKWKKGCSHCKQLKAFSWFADRSAWLYERKKKVLTDLDLTIITPSQWLADQVGMSFLAGYPTKVLNNGIDLDVFQPRASSFREHYDIPEEKFVVLGVAINWTPRKGADVFVRMAECLDPHKFQIVLVGTDKQVDKALPKSIISIHRTENQVQLAEIYSAADLFVNPTREENFPTVNIEALACGTPVLTYQTGGSSEIIDCFTGISVNKNDEKALYQAIQKIYVDKPYSREACRDRALSFAAEEKYAEYVRLYTQST